MKGRITYQIRTDSTPYPSHDSRIRRQIPATSEKFISTAGRNPALAGLLTLVFGLATAGCGSSSSSSSSHSTSSAPTSATAKPASSGPTHSGPAAVLISNYAYHPASITVAPGTKITFTNHDQTAHTATS